MSLQMTKQSSTATIPVWQKVYETAQGGYTLDTTGLTAGAVLRSGTPFTYNEATRKAKPAAITGTAPDTVSDAKGALLTDYVVEDGQRVDIVIRGTVYERRVKADHSDVAAEHKTALQGLIVFDKSF